MTYNVCYSEYLDNKEDICVSSTTALNIVVWKSVYIFKTYANLEHTLRQLSMANCCLMAYFNTQFLKP